MAVSVSLELWPSRRDSVEARVVAVHVVPGQAVRPGDLLVEVEVDKAVIAVESHIAGRVVEVHVRPGDTIRPGDPLVTIEEGAA